MMCKEGEDIRICRELLSNIYLQNKALLKENKRLSILWMTSTFISIILIITQVTLF